MPAFSLSPLRTPSLLVRERVRGRESEKERERKTGRERKKERERQTERERCKIWTLNNFIAFNNGSCTN
jgi:hypothetical protein